MFFILLFFFIFLLWEALAMTTTHYHAFHYCAPFISSPSLFLFSCLSFSCVRGANNFFNNVAKFFAFPPNISIFSCVKNIDNNTIEYYVHHKWEWIQSFPLIFLIILMIFFNILIVWNFTPHNFFVWHGHLHVYCCCYYCMVIVAIVSMCLLNLLVILCLSAFIPFLSFPHSWHDEGPICEKHGPHPHPICWKSNFGTTINVSTRQRWSELRINQGKVGIQSHSPYNREICLSARGEFSQIHSLLGIWHSKVSNNFGARIEGLNLFQTRPSWNHWKRSLKKSEIGLHAQFGNLKKQVKWLIN